MLHVREPSDGRDRPRQPLVSGLPSTPSAPPRHVEGRTIGNDTPLDHPFHPHVWPIQLLEAGGQEASEPLWLHLVNVPTRRQVKIRVAPEDFGGTTVYHCHILDHEVRGMMGAVLAQ